MKFLSLGLLLVSLNAISSTEYLREILPLGTHDGDDCVVKVSRTLFGNTKITVFNDFQRSSYIVNKRSEFKFIKDGEFLFKSENGSDSKINTDYLYVTNTAENRVSVLIGKIEYSPSRSYDFNIECTLY